MSTERHDHNSDEPSHAPGPDTGTSAAADGGDTAHEHPQDRPGRRQRLTVVAVAAAVLVAGGGGAYWATASGGDSTDGAGRTSQGASQPLRFDGPGVGVSGDAATPVAGGGSYRLTGTLPSGPASAPVYRTQGAVTQSAVQHLATLLGVSGAVATVGESWRVGGSADGGGPSLLVAKDAPGSWTYSRLGPPTAVTPPDHVMHPLRSDGSSGSGSTGVAGPDGTSSTSSTTNASGSSSSSSNALTDATPPVSAQQALAKAQPLLAGLGLSGAHTDASQTIGALRLVEADPVVGGLPTHGWATTVQVGADGLITTANGRLATVAKGATYPVVTAAKALAELNAKPVAEPAGAASCRLPVPTMTPLAPGTGGDDLRRSTPCLPPQRHPAEVRGATFGLATQYVDGAQALVPSWLFATAQAGVKTTSVVAQPAVDPKYVVYGNGSTSTPVAPVTPVTPVNPGGTMQTGPGQPADPRAPHAVKFTAYQAKGTTLTVTFWGGLCGTYQATADETATQVAVKVTETPAKPGKVCPMIEKALTAQVTLKQPLGDRKVVDATDGQPVRGQ
ncbi:hypothetical protein [Streptomyces sp. NPDC020917]|uniref:hypothetical protein n=1 Tax=Streptomyces sp. NPDC020917 TaxID=3365102 RepID=UPI003794CE3B